MASEPRKRKIESVAGNISSQVAKEGKFAACSHGSPVSVTHIMAKDHKVTQAKKFAISEAKQESWLGSFSSFDSSFGNFIVPVIPTRANLFK